MLIRLLLLFTIVPTVELLLLLQALQELYLVCHSSKLPCLATPQLKFHVWLPCKASISKLKVHVWLPWGLSHCKACLPITKLLYVKSMRFLLYSPHKGLKMRRRQTRPWV